MAIKVIAQRRGLKIGNRFDSFSLKNLHNSKKVRIFVE